MSMKLNLADRLLAMGRKFQSLGRNHNARHILGKLAAFGGLPSEIARETQAALGEIHLACKRPRRARKSFLAALFHQPDNPRYHYLLASTLNTRDPDQAKRAATHLQTSLQLDPDQPGCLSEYGLLLTRLGRSSEGLAALRRAVEMAPADPQVLGRLVEGLRREGDLDEARAVLRTALFRNNRDRRFRQLANEFELQMARRQQRAVQRKDREDVENAGPVLLPFVRLATDESCESSGGNTLRHDGPSTPARPHFSRHQRQNDRKRAQ
jgi:Tfp pilus assembly protein PilF